MAVRTAWGALPRSQGAKQMATISKIACNGRDTMGFNIGDTVGNGCRNRNDNGDVMVVQIMLHLIAHYFSMEPSPDMIGLASMDEVPEPTGKWDAKTGRAIQSYQ